MVLSSERPSPGLNLIFHVECEDVYIMCLNKNNQKLKSLSKIKIKMFKIMIASDYSRTVYAFLSETSKFSYT